MTKKYVMSATETDKKVYLFYHTPYQSNADFLENFKVHVEVRKSHNVLVGYHLGLVAFELQKNTISRATR